MAGGGWKFLLEQRSGRPLPAQRLAQDCGLVQNGNRRPGEWKTDAIIRIPIDVDTER
jgi:hypothetical protein